MLIKRHGIIQLLSIKVIESLQRCFLSPVGIIQKTPSVTLTCLRNTCSSLDTNNSWAFFKKAPEGVSFPNSVCNHQVLRLGIITHYSHKAGQYTDICTFKFVCINTYFNPMIYNPLTSLPMQKPYQLILSTGVLIPFQDTLALIRWDGWTLEQLESASLEAH